MQSYSCAAFDSRDVPDGAIMQLWRDVAEVHSRPDSDASIAYQFFKHATDSGKRIIMLIIYAKDARQLYIKQEWKTYHVRPNRESILPSPSQNIP